MAVVMMMAPRELQQKDDTSRDLKGLLIGIPLCRTKRNKIRKKKRRNEKTENEGKKKVKRAQ